MKKKVYAAGNLLLIFLLIYSVRDIHPFKENYSTLSLTERGYFELLIIGILSGISFAIAAERLQGRKWALMTFFAFLSACILPYSLTNKPLADIHVFLAYTGFFLAGVSVLKNILSVADDKLQKTLTNIYCLILMAALASYLIFLCVNAFSEQVFMIGSILINTYLFLRR